MFLLHKGRTQFASATLTKLPASNSHRECDDDYRGEIFRYGTWRMIECRDAIQWIIQKRRRNPAAGGTAWDALSYCTSKSGLELDWRRHTGFEAPELVAFPEHFAPMDGLTS